ncbi:FMN-binding negative transcriptional regulator [Rhizobium sp. 007]|uniref:FMN-binding negative transcriptional regulator n=1 Tax=Rhizobium sp. 007 TaxID=2785056 RepID=UPI00188F3D24|nr:FMN-binding negative transcriptional regulator [Rhizobium sp. 007]QPB18416.1 FMN-binding negative transcriptional regulator [Rhizobium sp. 007]
MYNPPAFVVEDIVNLHRMMRECRTANLITATPDGPMATLLPTFIDETEGEFGVIYAHLARANKQWSSTMIGDGLAVFTGPEAYITPSWYASKAEHGKVVPTWNYSAVHAMGPIEFFEDADRLLAVVDKLTNLHESGRSHPWSVNDAPSAFIAAQLRGIVGMRMSIRRLEGKCKMSQNRPDADRAGVRAGLSGSTKEMDRIVSQMVPG